MHGQYKENESKKLQQLFAEVTNQEPVQDRETTEPEFVEIDVLQLPPRSEVHQKTKLSINFNIRSPILRFSAVICLLIIILFVLYYFIGDNIILFFK